MAAAGIRHRPLTIPVKRETIIGRGSFRMKLFAGLMSVLILGVSVSHAQDAQPRGGHFDRALAVIQNSSWSGTFITVGPGVSTCYGTVTARFFPLQAESFSGGVKTVSYRHQVRYSLANPFFIFCETIGRSLSAVNVGDCDRSFPKKSTTENGQKVLVPVRTIIPKDGGTRAVISSPACVQRGGKYAIERLEFEVKSLEFTDERKRDAMKMTIHVNAAGLPAIILNYDMKRVGR